MAEQSFYTLAVHAAEDRNSHHGAVSVPVYNTSVFAFPDADEASQIHNEQKPGYYYGRLGNPTTAAFERAVAELEGGEKAVAFASGMAAVSASVLSFVRSGDHIVAPESMYSTTTNFLKHIDEAFGVSVTFVDASDAESYAAALRPNTRLFWIETPSNPLVRVTDIRRVAAIAREAGVFSVADNTFATPFNQRPLEMGVNAVVHSATKYIGGHSDLTAGIVITDAGSAAQIRRLATKLYGGTIAPQVAWLAHRGLKTLALRMERHNSNAYALANMLAKQSKVANVFYPGLSGHPGHETARGQMSGFGGMIAFDVGTIAAGKEFVNNVRLCTLATSLGGVETIVQHSATMTHSAIPADERLKAGISDGLIRLSVGIEDVDDLKADIENALSTI